jgi:hypothetical protein
MYTVKVFLQICCLSLNLWQSLAHKEGAIGAPNFATVTKQVYSGVW